MQDTNSEQIILDFYMYPPVGDDDWRYQYQTALVRMFEMQLLTKATLLDMANAESFEAAAELLTATDYALPRAGSSFEEVENILQGKRQALWLTFADLMIDKPLVELFKMRIDFANLRLAMRRTLISKPLGMDYTAEGNFPPELFEKVFEQQNDELFPDYMDGAAEQATMSFYKDKDVRRIDYAIDNAQAEYNLKRAQKIKNIFLLGLFRIQIDLTNIRTLLRLKFTESQQGTRFAGIERDVFLRGGYVGLDRLQHGLELGYESLGSLFFVTPYHKVVEAGAGYLMSNKSFLKLEQQCEEHLTGFLKTTIQITTGPQPIIAYLLMKENEIRTVRLILTAKKNFLDTQLILDRIT